MGVRVPPSARKPRRISRLAGFLLIRDHLPFLDIKLAWGKCPQLRGFELKKLLTAGLAAVFALSLTGCSPSQEDVCKEWMSNHFDNYMASVLKGDSSAASTYADGMRELAKKAPAELAAALNEDAMDVENSFKTAAICMKA